MQKGKPMLKMLCLLLAVCLGLAGCGKAEDPTALTKTFDDLLAGDFEAYYLFCSGGLPVDTSLQREEDGALYYQVSSKEYTSLESLRKLLEGIYARPEDVTAYLEQKDSQGKALLLEAEGKLWRSAQAQVMALRYEMSEGTLALAESEKEKASFTFEETGLDGSLYRCAMSMSKTAKGWRLDSTRTAGERTVLREGSGQSDLAGAGAARSAAEQFLAAVIAGDVEKLAQLTGVDPDTYRDWSQVRVSKAEIAKTQEELDSYGDYTVVMTVEQGAGILEEGQTEYRLLTGFLAYGDRVGPLYFQPAAKEYYNHLPTDQQTDAAANMVRDYLGFFPAEAFDSPQLLPAETVTEYCLIRLSQKGNPETVFTPQELQKAAESDFGLENFDGTKTPFYSKEAGGYLLYGRGGMTSNLLLELPQAEDGTARVTARLYSDPLCTRDQKALTFTLAENRDKSWQLVSAKWE